MNDLPIHQIAWPNHTNLELRPDCSEVVGHDKGSRKDRPDGHLNLGLVQTESKVSDDQLKSQKYPSVFKRKSINIWQNLKIQACIKNCSKFKICKLHIKLWCRYFWQLKSKRGRKVTFSWALNFWSVRSLFDRNTFTVDGIRTLFDL